MNSLDEGIGILKAKLKTLPDAPGVYRMLDEKGKVLYVGKAKNLKKRVTNYTQPERLSQRIKMMVSATRDLIVVTTKTEAEAFLLENDFIKNLKPYFNILLKDDKTFPHIVITDDDFPMVMKTRGAKKIKGEYFGPFASALFVNQTIKILQKAFLLRSCKNNVFSSRSRPCLLYQIKQCSAPCVGFISASEYAKSVKMAKDFLRGKSATLQKTLAAEMEAFAAAKEYEKAAVVRDRIKALNQVQTQNFTDIPAELKLDIVAVFKDENEAEIQIFFMRGGFNCGSFSYFYANVGEMSESEIMESFLGQFYKNHDVPDEVVVSHKPVGAEVIAGALGVKIKAEVIAGRRQLLETALLNARAALQRRKIEKSASEKVWNELAEMVGIPAGKMARIEVYDNSHIQGTNAVGAMIVAGKNGFTKNAYRRFNIQNPNVMGDDFGMMREVLTRRLKDKKDLPDLMIIDGGKGQVSAVQAVLDDMQLPLKIIGVAKGEKRNAGDEKIVFADEREDVKLPHNSPLLFFIERLRDEAHRFAIGTHRARRAKSMLANPLDEIEGVGAVRKKALLAHFGSAKAVMAASVFELEKVKGISKDEAQKIYDFFR